MTGYNQSGSLAHTHNASLVAETTVPESKPEDLVVYLLDEVLIPTIAVLGMIGNSLNVFILWWRHRRRDIDIMEKGALLGLIALAISDMAFCLVIFPKTFLPTRTWFTSWGIHLSYQLYSLYFQNVFIKTSTWLTLVVGFARYVGICHPLRARLCIGLSGIRTAILATFLFWIALEAPLIWTYEVKSIALKNSTFYYIDVGAFEKNKNLALSFTYIWAFVGYFFPVAVLIYCNSCLIRALRQSQKMRREAAVHNDSTYHDASTRITRTLVVLILMFILLVSPSEIIHFYRDTLSNQDIQYFKLAVICTNVLQAINFAFSFVLYCAVNATFRRTVTGWKSLLCDRFRPQQPQVIDISPHKITNNSSSSSTTPLPRTYYSALKTSLSAQSSVNSRSSRIHHKWSETCNV